MRSPRPEYWMTTPMKPAQRHSHQPELLKPDTTRVPLPKKMASIAAAMTPMRYSGIGRTIHMIMAQIKTIITPLPCPSRPLNGTRASSAHSIVSTAATMRRVFPCFFTFYTPFYLFPALSGAGGRCGLSQAVCSRRQGRRRPILCYHPQKDKKDQPHIQCSWC